MTFEPKVSGNNAAAYTDTVVIKVQKKDDDAGCFVSTAR